MIGGDERELPAKHSFHCNFPPRFQAHFAAFCPWKESVAVLRFRIQMIAPLANRSALACAIIERMALTLLSNPFYWLKVL